MARPRKMNADYFSHDADMRNDVKVKALRRRFGLDGYAVWCMLLETLTASDSFEMRVDEINGELIAADFDVTPATLYDIIEYCDRIGLLVYADEVLYSPTLKNRLQDVLDMRERKAQAGQLGAAKRWHTHSTPIADPSLSQEKLNTPIAENSKRKEIKRNEIKLKENSDIEGSQAHPAPATQISKFVKPTIEEIAQYCDEQNLHFDIGYFFDYYEANGWKINRAPMKNWKATARNWARRENEYKQQNNGGYGTTTGIEGPVIGKTASDWEKGAF